MHKIENDGAKNHLTEREQIDPSEIGHRHFVKTSCWEGVDPRLGFQQDKEALFKKF